MTPARNLARALNALGPGRSLVVVITVSFAALWLGVAVMFGVVPVRPPLIDRLGGTVAGDFMYFYPAGVLAGEGRAADVYDIGPITEIARARLGQVAPDLVWPYPPTMSLLLAPIGWLSPRAALVAWLGFTTAAMLTLGRLTLGSWILAPAVLIFPGSALALFTGQFSPVPSLLLGLMFFSLDTSPGLAGVALGLLVWKPQFGVAPGLGVLFERRWRVATLAIGTGCLVAITSVVAFGPMPWVRFVTLVLRHSQVLDVETPMSRFVSPFGTFHTFGVALQTSLVWHAIIAVPVIAGARQVWRSAVPQSRRALALTSATVLLSPYALDYDLAFLLLPWCLLIREACDDPATGSKALVLWLSLTCLVPLTYMSQLYTHLAIGAPLLVAILLMTYHEGHRTVRVRHA